MITTIITTYRRPLLLKRAVNSVLKQTYPDFQVHVFDNASNDETREIMEDFVEKDSRVKYHCHSKNIGMMANYEFAYQHIETPYFSLLSDDDYLLPDFYEVALQGFQSFPDAAFSACGIMQIDEKGNFTGDPLRLWKTEGLYTSPKGLFEMIKTRQRFPIPTGILFQHRFVKSAPPDFSKDIEIHWDPDYLLRIAARFPIVITKKCCGVYLAHSESFANSFYLNLFNDNLNGGKYLISTRKVLKKIDEDVFLAFRVKSKVRKMFKKYVIGDVVCFLIGYIRIQKLGDAHCLAKQFYRHFGFSFIVFYYHFLAMTLKYFPFIRVLFSKATIISDFCGKHLKIKSEGRLSKQNKQSDGLDEIKHYYDYGNELSNPDLK